VNGLPNLEQSFSIYSLGDSAITIDLGNHIDEQLNRKVLDLLAEVQALQLPGVKDIITAYSSVSVLYDPILVLQGNPAALAHREQAFGYLKRKLEGAWQKIAGRTRDDRSLPGDRNIIRIPVCYDVEYGPDLEPLAREKRLPREDIIRLHTSQAYRVYMIGFLPGFPYLGRIPAGLEIRRKDKPVPVAAGGVGIAGNQTGIYPLNSPGGWQIIGRTPLKLFDPYADNPVRLKIGDWVQFYSVTKKEFQDEATGFN
jgi:inhibitor of KinA